jgi:hypothetical protein
MSIYLTDGLWVDVRQLEGPRAPQPLPLENGFTEGTSYKVLGIHSASETSEAYFVLCNDRDEVWFISNRHLRVTDGAVYRKSAISDLPVTSNANPFGLR